MTGNTRKRPNSPMLPMQKIKYMKTRFVMGLQGVPHFADQDESTPLVLLYSFLAFPKRLCDLVGLVVRTYPLGASLKTKTTTQASSPTSLFLKSQCHLRDVSTMTPWYPKPSLLQHRSCPPLAPFYCGDLYSDLCQRDDQELSYKYLLLDVVKVFLPTSDQLSSQPSVIEFVLLSGFQMVNSHLKPPQTHTSLTWVFLRIFVVPLNRQSGRL